MKAVEDAVLLTEAFEEAVPVIFAVRLDLSPVRNAALNRTG